jgi:hypothetical protein
VVPSAVNVELWQQGRNRVETGEIQPGNSLGGKRPRLAPPPPDRPPVPVLLLSLRSHPSAALASGLLARVGRRRPKLPFHVAMPSVTPLPLAIVLFFRLGPLRSPPFPGPPVQPQAVSGWVLGFNSSECGGLPQRGDLGLVATIFLFLHLF